MQRGSLRIVWVWPVVLLAFITTAFARGHHMGGPFGHNGENGGGSATQQSTTQPAQNSQAVDDALATYNESRSKVSAANDALFGIAGKLHAAYTASPAYQVALAEQHAAQIAYAATVQPLQAAVEAQPAYQAALADKASAAAQLKKLQDDPASTPDQLTAAATAALNAGSRLTQLQAEGVSNNQNVLNARIRETNADAKIAQLDKQSDSAMRVDPRWISARQSLDAETTAEITAGEAYADALSAAGDLQAANTVTAEIQKQKDQLAKDGLTKPQ